MMRILFTAYPLHGHVNPMLPLALAARDAGHDVVVATGVDMEDHLQGYGLRTWSAGPTHAEVASAIPPSPMWFVSSATGRAASLIPEAGAWGPDLVVSDEFDLAGPVVARALRARLVVRGVGVMLPMPIWTEYRPAVDDLHERWGCPDGARWVRSAEYLDAFPRALHAPGERVWHRRCPLRPEAGVPRPGERLPVRLEALPYAETIHLTLGTLFHETPRVLSTAITGLRELPLNLVVTCGPGIDPASFGPQPDHVVIAPYLPHALLLPRCRLVVSQGGAGIMLGALAHGLPQLMLPQGADQFINADLCTRAGAALALQPDAFSAEAVATAARRLIDERTYTRAARIIRTELDAMPGAQEVLADLAGE